MRGHEVSRKPAKAESPRPVFPFAVTLRAVALLIEGDSSPALYIAADNEEGRTRLYRVPEGCRVEVSTPHPLPEGGQGAQPRAFLPAGSRAVFTLPTGRASSLALNTVRLYREVLEAVQAHGEALEAEEKARQVIGGEEKKGPA